MNAIPDKPHLTGIHTMPAGDYHRQRGVSKSLLDIIHVSPALLEWSYKAPRDEEAKSAVNTGTALHTLLLEPERFASEYTADFVPPKGAIVTVDDLKSALDKRGIAYLKSEIKSALTAKLLSQDPTAPVSDALYAEWERGVNGRDVMSASEYRKLFLMRDSILAHPIARKLLEEDGFVERCHFWKDEETGETCRARMDREIPRYNTILDVKTTGDIGRFSDSIREYRYYVQDVFYSTGYETTVGTPPRFVFLAVGTMRDRGRFPVRLFSLGQQERDIGEAEYRADLAVYSKCKKTGVWPGIEPISLPGWFLAKQGAK